LVKEDPARSRIDYPYIRLSEGIQNMAKMEERRLVDNELVRTGIDGLDKVLGGGIPRGRCVLVMGGPGTGKTTLCLQFLYNGAVEFGENGIYITLQESPEHIRKDMLKIGLDFEILEEEDRLRIIDYSASAYLSSISERVVGYSSESFLQMEKSEEMAEKFGNLIKSIKETAREIQAQRIVLDPITGLMFQEPDPIMRRIKTHGLFQAINETGCTSLVVSEARVSEAGRDYQAEEYFANGVILLQNFGERGTVVRGISVLKMRGVAHDLQPRPCQIGKKGIIVFPDEKIFSEKG